MSLPIELPSRPAASRTSVRPSNPYVLRRPGPGRSIDAALSARQHGVALVIGLVLLVVLALLGATAYSVATQDERIAGNARDHARALDAAETALRTCEQIAPTANFNGTGGMLSAPTVPGIVNNNATWLGDTPGWDQNPAVLLVSSVLTNPDWPRSPVCVAEHFQISGSPVSATSAPQDTVDVVRVTAAGYGYSPETRVVLISYFSY